MENLPLSVSDTIALVNQTLEYAFPTLVVEGEVASYKVNQGKFVFFDIKDDGGTLGCFMMLFAQRVPLEDGMRVQVVATPKLTNWGRFSLTVREVRPVGEGSLKRAFELLRVKLEVEGLFAPERKRRLVTMPQRIGVISSTDSAGYKDFITILNDRWGGVDVTVAHTQVQGSPAPAQIMRALAWFNEQADTLDAIVIIRGGGSADDLSTFNDEPLVRAIAASRIPTLVGVGHEVDVTLADMVADVRAATPTDAAQILVPDRREVSEQVTAKMRHVLTACSRQLALSRERMKTSVQRALARTVSAEQSLRYRYGLLRTVIVQIDPRQVLRRGYALVFNEAGKSLGAAAPKIGDMLQVETARFSIKTEVHDVRKNTE